jgi:hypothetical protein
MDPEWAFRLQSGSLHNLGAHNTRILCVLRRPCYVILCNRIRHYYDVRARVVHVLKVIMLLLKLLKLRFALLLVGTSRVYAHNKVIEVERVVKSSGKEGGDPREYGIPGITERHSTGREKEPGRAESKAHASLGTVCQ